MKDTAASNHRSFVLQPAFRSVCALIWLLGAQALGQQIPSAQRAYEEGLRLEGEGRHEQAARKFQDAIDINPEFSDAYNQFAASELHAGKTQEAIKAFLQLTQLDPTNEKAMLAARRTPT
jgi:tetratricopeptide (TPR) repeat protein